MPQMTYYRRPQLAGKSIRYITSAAVRGNVRRNDVDGIVPYPYFSNIAPNSTLVVESWDPVNENLVQATAVFSSTQAGNERIDVLLAELNSALTSIKVTAFDDGGCVGLRSQYAGGDSLVRVVGGSAAAALGFDVSAQTFRSVGGDMASSGEARLGQPFGTALPNVGENLSSETFVRSLGRVLANTDVLYAELMRKDAVFKKVATVTPSVSTSAVTLGASIKIFSGGVPAGSGLTPVLSNSSTKEDLAHFFAVVDATTKQFSQCRVVGVTGPNGGALGVEQVIIPSLIIDYILNGRVIEVDTASFVTSGVLVGDYVAIAGAQNNTPWSNNGYRWVVEEVIDSTHLALRPMTPVELAAVGTTVTDEQPVVELNSIQSGSEAFGAISVGRGPYLANATLQVSPPLPANFNGEIWACVPLSKRDRQLNTLVDQGYHLFAASTANYDAAPNALLSRPSFSVSAPNVTVGPFMVRWHGRAVRVPGQTLSFSGAATGTQYIYWDENDCQVKASTSNAFLVSEARAGITSDELAGVTPNTANKGKQLATVAVISPGTFLTVTTTAKIEASDNISFLVGPGGNFQKLENAFEYLNRLSASGFSFSWAEVIVIGPLTAPTGGSGWTVPCSGVHVRGASPDVQLSHNGTDPLFTVQGSNTFLLEDVKVDLTKTIAAGASAGIYLRGLVDLTGSLRRRTFDSPNQNVDIGYSAPAVDIGKAGAFTNVRGKLDVVQDGTFHGDIWVDANKRVIAGGVGTSQGARLDAAGGEGVLALSGPGGEKSLSRANLGILVGGSGSDAQSLHKHQDLSDAISTETTNRTTAISNLQPSVAPPDIADAGAIGSDSSHFARRDHTHKGVHALSAGSGTPITITNPNTTPVLTIPKADTTHDGYLSSADWAAFNAKQPSGSYQPLLGYTPLNQAGDTVTGQLKIGAGAVTSKTGDIGVSRDETPATGVIYLGNGGGTYLFFDGTNYQLPAADLYSKGSLVRTLANTPDAAKNYGSAWASWPTDTWGYDWTPVPWFPVGVRQRILRVRCQTHFIWDRGGDPGSTNLRLDADGGNTVWRQDHNTNSGGGDHWDGELGLIVVDPPDGVQIRVYFTTGHNGTLRGGSWWAVWVD